ncbi:hypothetical protein NSA47_08930 [Irregularibacter muris]|uniref:Uncharacterized protein n=2 Tax=Irregularibacter muris TaxID=1796619 RepID=A0AAE3HGU7_9FIRM|nr:hypothetical protein [Irregularibacter muris]
MLHSELNKRPPDRMYLSFEIIKDYTTEQTPKMTLDQQEKSEFYKQIDMDKKIHIDEKSIYFDSIIFTPYNALAFIAIDDHEWFNNSSYEIMVSTGMKSIGPDVIHSYNEELDVENVLLTMDRNDFKDSKYLKFEIIDKSGTEQKTDFGIEIKIPE